MSETFSQSYPVLPLRDIVVFPHMIVPLFVGREKSVRALEDVMADDKQILLSSQIDPSVDDPEAEGIYRVGVLANVLQLLKLPDGTVKVLVEGKARVRIVEFLENDELLRGADRPAHRIHRRRGRGRSAGARGGRRFRALRQDQEEHPRRGARRRGRGARTGAAGRPRRGPSRHRGRRKAGPAGNPLGRRPAGEGLRPHGSRDVGPAGRAQDQVPREDPDGEDPARVLSERADEGHSEGTRRRRGRPERDRRVGRAHREDQVLQGGAREGRGRAEEAEVDVARCRPRRRLSATISTGCSACPGARKAGSRRISSRPRRCSTPITTVSRRSRSGSSNISPCRRVRPS